MSRKARRGDIPRMKALMEKKESVSEYDSAGWTPLLWAAFYGYPDCVSWLVDQGADIDAANSITYSTVLPGASPVIVATSMGWEPIVKDLVSRGANLEHRDDRGMNALDYARRGGHPGIIALLEAKTPKTAAKP